MRDHDPIVLRRMLALRQFPLLDAIDLDELAMLAVNVSEQTFRRGSVVARPGRVGAVQLVIDGAIAAGGKTWDARHGFGALEAIASRDLRTAAIATTDTHTLRLAAADLDDILEDNFGILVGVLRGLASSLVDIGLPARPPPAPAEWGPELHLVDRLVLLRRQLPFARARLQALSMLAHASTEVAFPAGAVVAREGVASDALVLAAGRLSGDPGDAIGLLEAFACRPYTTTIEAATPVRALAVPAPALVDMLEDHTDLGLDIAATFARALLDATR